MEKKKLRWIFFGAWVFLGGLLLFLVRKILGPFFLAFILAYLLSPLVDWLVKHKLGRRMAIGVVFVGIIITIGIVFFLVIPTLYSELAKLSVTLPDTMSLFNEKLMEFRNQFRAAGLPNRVVQVLDQNLSQGEEFLAVRLQYILSNLPEVLGTISLYALSPVMAIYFLVDWKRLENNFMQMAERRWRLEWQRIWRDISHVVRLFVRENLVVAAVVGILVGLGVKLVGMDYALLIGIICGVFDLIPYFGPLIGGIPSVLLGLTESPVMALKVALVIIVVQQLEGNVISPKLMGDSVGLHPLVIVFALLAGGEIAGFWGMLLSVPFAAMLRVIFRHIYFRLVSSEVK